MDKLVISNSNSKGVSEYINGNDAKFNSPESLKPKNGKSFSKI